MNKSEIEGKFHLEKHHSKTREIKSSENRYSKKNRKSIPAEVGKVYDKTQQPPEITKDRKGLKKDVRKIIKNINKEKSEIKPAKEEKNHLTHDNQYPIISDKEEQPFELLLSKDNIRERISKQKKGNKNSGKRHVKKKSKFEKIRTQNDKLEFKLRW